MGIDHRSRLRRSRLCYWHGLGNMQQHGAHTRALFLTSVSLREADNVKHPVNASPQSTKIRFEVTSENKRKCSGSRRLRGSSTSKRCARRDTRSGGIARPYASSALAWTACSSSLRSGSPTWPGLGGPTTTICERTASGQAVEWLAWRFDLFSFVFVSSTCRQEAHAFQASTCFCRLPLGAVFLCTRPCTRTGAVEVLAAVCRGPRKDLRRLAARALGALGWNGHTEV